MGYFHEEVDVNKRVLLAVDETYLLNMMMILLDLLGFDVFEAADGYEAVDKAVEEEPDLILMDIAMPVMDGIDSAKTIRRHEELRRIPIVAVTAYGDFYSQRARKAGCTDVIQKPIDFAQLKPMVERYLN